MEIVFARRFRGPLTSANGGYACGRLAAFVDADAVEVTLRLPPPLERQLEVREDADAVVLVGGGAVVAEARPGSVDGEVPEPVSVEEAEVAASRHVRIGSPAFRECFTCGIRAEDDGLGVYVGPVAGCSQLQAAPWSPRESEPEIVWAAIDCPGAYAVGVAGRGEIVLGRMAARVLRLPVPGRRCVVMSWPRGEEGRKLFAGTALFDEEGELLAVSKQTWIEPRA